MVSINIIAHRGFHSLLTPPPPASNSPEALLKACVHGYGFETDVRDSLNRLVISHDPADSDSPGFIETLSPLAHFSNNCTFALNIKSDGIAQKLKTCLDGLGITNYFAFDMSIPQMVIYRDLGITYFTGQSDIQPVPVLYDNAAGIWADCFYSEGWITHEIILSHIKNRKKICFVSPELHKRGDYRAFWNRIRAWDDGASLMLCTDYPDEAEKFFRQGGKSE